MRLLYFFCSLFFHVNCDHAYTVYKKIRNNPCSFFIFQIILTLYTTIVEDTKHFSEMGNKASNHEESILESHTHDSHHAALKAMCRICGFRPQTQSQARNHNSRTRKVTQSSSQIKACFDIDVALDIQTIHPPTLCESCYKTARRKNHDLQLYRPINIRP